MYVCNKTTYECSNNEIILACALKQMHFLPEA